MGSHNGRLNIINREEYDSFVQTPRTSYGTRSRIKSVKFNRISHDVVYEKLRRKGHSIDITSSEILVNNKKPMDGIFSPLYGSDTTQDAPVYTCDCHRLIGGTNRGRICPDCNTEVRSIEADLRTTLYIDIAPYHILTFHGYKALNKVVKGLNDCMKYVKRIDARGKAIDEGKMGLLDLYDRYDDEFLDLTGIPKNVAFTSKIPVYSARLRPLMRMGIHMTILDVNKAYLSIVTSRNILKAAPMINALKRDNEVQKTVNQIQADFMSIWNHVTEQMKGKGGVLRKSLASGRVDNSSRMVISAGDDLQPHEIDIPYQTMMVIYEEEIANYLSKLENIPISKAISLVEENQVHRNDKFVKIINQLLKSKKGIWALINRNPTISESGILYCRVRKIHDDSTDMTMHMPPDILSLVAADYDGDQMTYLAVKAAKYHPLFMTMCPTYTFIDRANGKFNEAMDFKKDYSALISAAWSIDNVYDAYLTNPDELTDGTMRQYGLITNDIGDSARRSAIIRTLANGDDPSNLKSRFVLDEAM